MACFIPSAPKSAQPRLQANTQTCVNVWGKANATEQHHVFYHFLSQSVPSHPGGPVGLPRAIQDAGRAGSGGRGGEEAWPSTLGQSYRNRGFPLQPAGRHQSSRAMGWDALLLVVKCTVTLKVHRTDLTVCQLSRSWLGEQIPPWFQKEIWGSVWWWHHDAVHLPL